MKLNIYLLIFFSCFSFACLAQPVITRQELMQEIDIKMKRLYTFMELEHLDGLVLTKVNNFSWITAGIGDNHILLSSEAGVASLLIMKSGKKFILANDTELPHLLEEEVNGLGYEAKGWGWWENKTAADLIKELAPNKVIGSDINMEGVRDVGAAFNQIRYQLTSSELKKYRWVCRETALAVEAVCKTLKPGMTDREIEALASYELQKRGLRPTVVLIGVDQRLEKYYHYPPVGKKLANHVFVNVCAKAWGLTSSVGRYVYFGKPPTVLLENMSKSAYISAQLEAATIAGVKASDIFAKGQQYFAEQRLNDGWKTIHFGGGIGYAEREWVATATSQELIEANAAYAWNPFTVAALSFDTIFLHEDGNLEKLTYLDTWPVIDITINGKIYKMPGLLVR